MAKSIQRGSSIGIQSIVVGLQSAHPSLGTRLRLKKKKGSSRLSARLEGNYGRRQNVIRFPSEAEVREGKVLRGLPQIRLPGPAPGLLRI